ncbi:MAG: alpha/beta hydrolase [Flavobacteriales bacterium]
MERRIFQHGDFQLEYGILGTGSVPILCFHGFGRPLEDMYLFSQILAEGEYIVSAHLFHHGNSSWSKSLENKEGLSPSAFAMFIDEFMLFLKTEEYRLIGYSLGGRICMNLFLERSDRIDKMLLVAPDGLYKNPFYVWSIKSYLGRKLFSSLINNPKPLLDLVNFLRLIRLFPVKLHRFIHVHMGANKTTEERARILSSWTTFVQFFPDLNQLVKLLKTEEVNFSLILGEFDSVIKKKYANKLIDAGQDPSSIHYLNSGHLLLNEKTIQHIQTSQLWN